MLTLRLTRLAYFNSLAYPSAMALIIVVAAAMTVAPAVLVVGSRFGLLDPKRMMKTRGWRKVGTATVRWPKPILAAATSRRAARHPGHGRLQDQLRRPPLHSR